MPIAVVSHWRQGRSFVLIAVLPTRRVRAVAQMTTARTPSEIMQRCTASDLQQFWQVGLAVTVLPLSLLWPILTGKPPFGARRGAAAGRRGAGARRHG